MKLEFTLENGVPVLKNASKVEPPDNTEVHAYIAAKAKELGIDPKVALEVWSREGKAGWQSNYVKNGKREKSYGPYQLYTEGGLGNKFQAETGLDPSDPANWRQGVDFALQQAKSGGWGPWYGAKKAGITGYEGINGVPALFTPGGGAVAAAGTARNIGLGQPPVAPNRTYLGIPAYKEDPTELGAPAAVGGALASALSNFGKQKEAPKQSAKPGFGDLTGGVDFGNLINDAAAPTKTAGDVVQIPKGWTLQQLNDIAKEYGVPISTVIQMLQGQNG